MIAGPDSPQSRTDPRREGGIPPDRPKVRLHVEQPLREGQPLTLAPEAAHYLFSVMRLAAGSEIALFNGTDGEWAARLTPQGKRGGEALPLRQSAPQRDPADLWLIFAPLKKARTDFLIEKATEMGVARLVPVQTAFTNAERIKRERLIAQAGEAAEQCGATHRPEVEELQPLERLLAGWPAGRRLYFADEARAGEAIAPPVPGPAAILIGPEGGFSPAERARLRALPFVAPLALGPRILRAETAAVAALVLWQSTAGDWREPA